MNDQSRDTTTTSVCIWPGPGSDNMNPYIHSFAQTISDLGYDVHNFHPVDWLRRCYSDYRLLIVHWPEAATFGSNRIAQQLSHHLFVIQLRTFRRFGGKVVWIFHNDRPHDKSQLSLDGFARCVDGVVSPSNTGLGLAHAQFPFLASHPSGVARLGRYEFSPEDSVTRTSLGIPPDAKVAISFGAIRRYKGLERSIEAYRQLEDSHVLLIVGKPVDQGYGDELEENTKDLRNVHLVFDAVSDERLAAYMKLSDFALFTFKHLLHSSSVVAARSVGLPVLCPPVGSLEEYASFDEGIALLSGKPLHEQVVEASSLRRSPPPNEYEWSHIANDLRDFLSEMNLS